MEPAGVFILIAAPRPLGALIVAWQGLRVIEGSHGKGGYSGTSIDTNAQVFLLALRRISGEVTYEG
jgi:hypothetical protein